jgi:ribonuclease P protein component
MDVWSCKDAVRRDESGSLLPITRRPLKIYLRRSSEFRNVYQNGKRYDGSLITAFVLPNDQTNHRLGITVSRKTASRAVDRNRAKRLLRETFRLNKDSLDLLKRKYDWVLNGKRSLVSVKVMSSLEEFDKIMTRVAADEP